MSGKATDIILAGALASTSDEGLGAGFGVGVAASVSGAGSVAGVTGASSRKSVAESMSIMTMPAAIMLFFKDLLFAGAGSLVGVLFEEGVLLSAISKFSG